jgi:hypothetical protein
VRASEEVLAQLEGEALKVRLRLQVNANRAM